MIGYCATARNGMDKAPQSDISSDTTQAKTGRSMKNAGMAETSVDGWIVDSARSALGWGRAPLGAPGRVAAARRPGLWAHRITRHEFLKAFNDDSIAGLDAIHDHPMVIDHAAEPHRL